MKVLYYIVSSCFRIILVEPGKWPGKHFYSHTIVLNLLLFDKTSNCWVGSVSSGLEKGTLMRLVFVHMFNLTIMFFFKSSTVPKVYFIAKKYSSLQ